MSRDLTLSEELTARGFISQFTADDLAEIVDGPKRTIYHGIDPSADSAHAGNFVIWMLLRHLAQKGHKIIFLVGGGTGMIGDPKPDAERVLRDMGEIEQNVEKLKTQAERIVGGEGEIEFVNNADWLLKLNLVEFLRDIGKHFTVNELIKKEAIARRLESDTGISYTEFAYPLLQGYDYLELHRTRGCDVQVGGSDQWGNIVAGVDLIRRKEQAQVYAITVPLIVDKATGKKFGKSEGNAVWLDAEKTSPYTFYQFWLNVSDESVVDHLKRFTFLSLDEIGDIQLEWQKDPAERLAQQRLAYEVTELVHGKDQAESAKKVSEALFVGGDMGVLSNEEKEIVLNNAPVHEISAAQTIVDVLVASGLASSKREARTFVESGAVTLAGEKVESVDRVVELSVGEMVPLRRGKKRFMILYRK